MVLFPCPFYSHECLYLPQTAKVWRTFAAETSILNSMIFFFYHFYFTVRHNKVSLFSIFNYTNPRDNLLVWLSTRGETRGNS